MMSYAVAEGQAIGRPAGITDQRREIRKPTKDGLWRASAPGSAATTEPG